MRSIGEMIEIKKGAENRLFSISGVNAVGFGGKVSGGRPIGEFAIIVYVDRKRPRNELRPEEMIPSEVNGVKTDVVERSTRKVKYAPLQGGVDIIISQVISTGEGKDFEGTLGCIARTASVKDTDPPDVLLSCRHVLFSYDMNSQKEYGEVGDPVTVSSCCGTCHPTIAKVLKSPPVDNFIDAAIARLEPGQTSAATIHGVPVKGVLDLSDPNNIPVSVKNLTYTVYQYGEKSGLTKGIIYDLHFTDQTMRPNTNQIKIMPIGRDHFTQHGDSGSVVYNESNQILGLHWGGDEPAEGASPNPPFASFASHIQLVLNAFTSLPSGAIRVATNPPAVIYTVPGIRKLPPALEQFHRDLVEIGCAENYIGLYGRHQEEVGWLLEHRRPFISAWHRNDGPAMVRMLKDLVENRIEALPVRFGGGSWAERVRRVAGALMLCGSEPLQSDVLHYTPFVSSLGGRCYTEMLELLRAVATVGD